MNFCFPNAVRSILPSGCLTPGFQGECLSNDPSFALQQLSAGDASPLPQEAIREFRRDALSQIHPSYRKYLACAAATLPIVVPTSITLCGMSSTGSAYLWSSPIGGMIANGCGWYCANQEAQIEDREQNALSQVSGLYRRIASLIVMKYAAQKNDEKESEFFRSVTTLSDRMTPLRSTLKNYFSPDQVEQILAPLQIALNYVGGKNRDSSLSHEDVALDNDRVTARQQTHLQEQANLIAKLQQQIQELNAITQQLNSNRGSPRQPPQAMQ